MKTFSWLSSLKENGKELWTKLRWSLRIGWSTNLIRRPGFWLLAAVFVLITVPHYEGAIEHPSFLTNLMDDLDLDRHAFERILYLAPIIWAGFLFGVRGAFLSSVAALGCMLPRAIFISDHTVDAIFETGAVFVIGNVLALRFNSLRR